MFTLGYEAYFALDLIINSLLVIIKRKGNTFYIKSKLS